MALSKQIHEISNYVKKSFERNSMASQCHCAAQNELSVALGLLQQASIVLQKNAETILALRKLCKHVPQLRFIISIQNKAISDLSSQIFGGKAGKIKDICDGLDEFFSVKLGHVNPNGDFEKNDPQFSGIIHFL